MNHPSGVRVTGPLVSHLDGLWSDLLALGYARDSAKNLLRVASHLSRWLCVQRLELSDLTTDRIDAYLQVRRAAGFVCWLTPKGLEPLLCHLRSVGAVPAPDPPRMDPSPVASLLRAYESYLLKERGITTGTTDGYLRVARKFLADTDLSPPDDLHRLSTAVVSRFVLHQARSSDSGTPGIDFSALRSFLRYLHFSGHCRDLSAAVPAAAGYRQSGLPKGATEEEVRRLLAVFDRETATGQRNFAILLLLSRLGLRAKEVATLEFEDVRWTRGELLVRCKGSQGLLPLPQDVGEALADYVQRGRPRSTSRKIFLLALAPYRDITSKTVGAMVRGAAARAGLPKMGSHRLRHAAATLMLQKGASLTEVALVLRHGCIQTTAIYAKVDRRRLRLVARAWLGGES
jgi:integrase/recombinase XerD